MKRGMHRTIYVGEERVEHGYRFDRHWYADRKAATRAQNYVDAWPERRRRVVYERQEVGVYPGRCLWVVERKTGDVWEFVAVCRTAAERDRVRSLERCQTREMRFVRRRVRAW